MNMMTPSAMFAAKPSGAVSDADVLRIAQEMTALGLLQATGLALHRSLSAGGDARTHLVATMPGGPDWYFRISPTDTEEKVEERLTREHRHFAKGAAQAWPEFVQHRDVIRSCNPPGSPELPAFVRCGLALSSAVNVPREEMIVLIDAVGEDGRRATRHFSVKHHAYATELRPMLEQHDRGLVAATEWSARGAIAAIDAVALHVMHVIGMSPRSVLHQLQGRAKLDFEALADAEGCFYWADCRVTVDFTSSKHQVTDGIIRILDGKLPEMVAASAEGASLDRLAEGPLLPGHAKIRCVTDNVLIELESERLLVDADYSILAG